MNTIDEKVKESLTRIMSELNSSSLTAIQMVNDHLHEQYKRALNKAYFEISSILSAKEQNEAKESD